MSLVAKGLEQAMNDLRKQIMLTQEASALSVALGTSTQVTDVCVTRLEEDIADWRINLITLIVGNLSPCFVNGRC